MLKLQKLRPSVAILFRKQGVKNDKLYKKWFASGASEKKKLETILLAILLLPNLHPVGSLFSKTKISELLLVLRTKSLVTNMSHK